MKKYYFRYQTRKNGDVMKEQLHFSEENEIIERLKNKENILDIFQSMTFIDAIRSSFNYVDENDKKIVVIDSKDNKIRVDLNEYSLVA